MMRVHTDRKRFSGDRFAAIGERIQSQPRYKRQSRVYLFSFPLQASRQVCDRGGNLGRIRRHGHFINFSSRGNQGSGGRLPIEAQRRIASRYQSGIHRSHERVHTHVPNFIVFVQWAEWLSKQTGIKLPSILSLQRDGAPQKWRAQESGDSLGAMIGKRVEPDFTPGLSIEGRNVIQGKQVTFGGFAAVEVQHNDGLSVAPRRRVRVFLGRTAQLEGSIGGELHGLRGEQSRGLMMTVSCVHTSPAIDHDVWAEASNHADHVLEDLVAPDAFRFLRRLGIAKIFGSREVEPHAVATRRFQQFLRADQSELRRLFGTKIVLAAFAACQGKQRHIRVKPPSKIGEHGAALVVGMSGHVEDPRGDASSLDRLDSFRQAGPCPRRWWELRERGGGQNCDYGASHQDKNRQTLKIGIHATSTAMLHGTLTLNRQPSTANLQRAIVSLPAREPETRESPVRFPQAPTFASGRFARRATPIRSWSVRRARDTTTS